MQCYTRVGWDEDKSAVKYWLVIEGEIGDREELTRVEYDIDMRYAVPTRGALHPIHSVLSNDITSICFKDFYSL